MTSAFFDSLWENSSQIFFRKKLVKWHYQYVGPMHALLTAFLSPLLAIWWRSPSKRHFEGLAESVELCCVNPVGAKATDMTAEGWVVSDYYFVDKIFTRKSQFNIGRGHGNMPANNLKHLLRPFWGHSRPSSRLGQRGRIWDLTKYSAVQLWKKIKGRLTQKVRHFRENILKCHLFLLDVILRAFPYLLEKRVWIVKQWVVKKK